MQSLEQNPRCLPVSAFPHSQHIGATGSSQRSPCSGLGEWPRPGPTNAGRGGVSGSNFRPLSQWLWWDRLRRAWIIPSSRPPPPQGRMRGSFPPASSRSATNPPGLTQLQQTFGAAQRRRGQQGSGGAEGAECVCRQQCNRRNCAARACLGRSGSGPFFERRSCNSLLYQRPSALRSGAANTFVAR
jgi:hypothetical protein